MQLEHILQAHGLLGRGGKETPLPTIQNFRGSSNDLGTEIILNWDNPTVIEFQKVQIFMSDTDISNLTYEELVLNGNMIVNAKVSTHTVTGLKHNDTRYFKAFGIFNVLGEEKVSSGVSLTVTTKDIIPPATISVFSAKEDNGQVTLTWANPIDSDFSKVKILYKQGSYPSSPSDGMVAYEGSGNTVTITGLTNDVEYYFRAFTYDTSGNINDSTDNQQIKAIPTAQKIYGIVIDETNSNPETAVTYIDDAVGFTPMKGNDGNFQWGSWEQVFNDMGIKPCVLKNGIVQYYLNPNDYTKKLDGTSADIESGNDGDVMIEFPTIHWKVNRVGTSLYVRYSTKEFEGSVCKAHMVGTTIKDKIYLPAYIGSEVSGKLRSLSGKTPVVSKTIGAFRALAQANGSGYQQMLYYQILMLQVLYLVWFKNMDSQTALGRGYVDNNNGSIATGGTNQKGMFYGSTNGSEQNKFAGIEDFWGNVIYFIDGIYSNDNWNILISNQTTFNDAGVNYENYGQGAIENTVGYISKVQGGNETGFIIKEKDGSTTQYYADNGYLTSGRLATFGGYWSYGDAAGAFLLALTRTANYSYSGCGARLCFIGTE